MQRSSSKTKPRKIAPKLAPKIATTATRSLVGKPVSRRLAMQSKDPSRTVAKAVPIGTGLVHSVALKTEPTALFRSTTMNVNEQIKRQAEQFMNAAKDARIPEQFQAMAEEGVNKSREAFDKISSAAKDQAKIAEDLMLASQAGARAIGAKIVDNTVSNTVAVFDAAQAIARAKTLPDATRLHAEFIQKQFALAGAQTQELFELSTRVAKQSYETVNSVAAKTFDQAKKAR